MLKNITLGQYIPGDSAIYRLDPRVKILLVVAFITTVFLAKGFVSYGLLLAFVLVVTAMSKIRIKYLIRSIKPLLFILVFTFILNVFFSAGETIWLKVWFLTITKEGVLAAVFMMLRLSMLVMGTSLLTLTTSPISLTDGLERLMNPLKKIRFPAHELAMMMTIALRFIPTLLEETDKIMKAQSARGADFESGNLLKRASAMVPLLVPLFVSSFRRADDLAMAMEARCYRGDINRTRMRVLHVSAVDWLAGILMLGLVLIIFIWSNTYA